MNGFEDIATNRSLIFNLIGEAKLGVPGQHTFIRFSSRNFG